MFLYNKYSSYEEIHVCSLHFISTSWFFFNFSINFILHFQGTFRSFDLDQSGTISGPELREALRASDIQVNNRILNMLMLRYSNEKGELEMEDFLHCCIKLTAMIRKSVRVYYRFYF